MGVTGEISGVWNLSGEIDETGGSNVTIEPTLTTGTKIADYTIDGEAGALYAPSGGSGTTPDISAAATVDGSYGDPQVNVVETGTLENPVFTFNFTGINGAPGADGTDGADGADGTSATIRVGSTTTGPSGSSASVTNSGTSTEAVLDFVIPRGQAGSTGSPGAAASITVGTVTTVSPNDAATVTNVGSPNAAIFDFEIPQGETGQNGADGADGADGTDGTSAYCSVSKTGDTATITCTDAIGTTTATITDGANGQGVPSGGTTDQILYKTSNTDYATGWKDFEASDVSYDNTASGMTATDVQDAVDELNASLVNLINIADFDESYSLGSNSRNNENIDISSLGLTNVNQILAITVMVDQPAWVHCDIYNTVSTSQITIGLNNTFSSSLNITVKVRVLYSK